jgi:hypothetical protein
VVPSFKVIGCASFADLSKFQLRPPRLSRADRGFLLEARGRHIGRFFNGELIKIHLARSGTPPLLLPAIAADANQIAAAVIRAEPMMNTVELRIGKSPQLSPLPPFEIWNGAAYADHSRRQLLANVAIAASRVGQRKSPAEAGLGFTFLQRIRTTLGG